MSKYALILVLLALSGLSACKGAEEPANRWVFTCPDGFRFDIEYSEDGSMAEMSSVDGRAQLSVARSGSGARYTDGTLVFWNKGTAAFIEQNGDVIHPDCQGEPVSSRP